MFDCIMLIINIKHLCYIILYFHIPIGYYIYFVSSKDVLLFDVHILLFQLFKYYEH